MLNYAEPSIIYVIPYDVQFTIDVTGHLKLPIIVPVPWASQPMLVPYLYGIVPIRSIIIDLI